MNYFDAAVKETMRLLAIDSVQAPPSRKSPFGDGVGDCLAAAADTARAMGLSVHDENGYYVSAEIGEGRPFGILGHLDVVPHGESWSANPLGEIKDGKIYGRGVLDDKGPMVCCLFALKQLLDEGLTPKRRVRVIFGGNEESGWQCMERFKAVDVMPEEGFSPDGDFPVINCEKGLADYTLAFALPPRLLSINGGDRPNVVPEKACAIIAGELALAGEDVDVVTRNGKTCVCAYGKPAHASTPAQGDSALWKLLNYLAAALGGEFIHMRDVLCHNDGAPLGMNFEDAESGALTFNAGMINGGVEKGCVDVTVDIRFPVSCDKQQIMNLLDAAVRPMSIKLDHFHDPHYLPPDNALIARLLSAYMRVTGQTASPIAIGGGTYARCMKSGAAFGPIFPDAESTIHQKDECVRLDEFEKMYEIYLEAIRSICF